MGRARHRQNSVSGRGQLGRPGSLRCGAEGTTAAGTLLVMLGLGQVGAETQPLKGTAESKVNLNMATQAELEKLPGVGEPTAKKILAGRPYKVVADLCQGLGEDDREDRPARICRRDTSAGGAGFFGERPRPLRGSVKHRKSERIGQVRLGGGANTADNGDGMGECEVRSVPPRRRALVRQDRAGEVYDGSRGAEGRIPSRRGRGRGAEERDTSARVGGHAGRTGGEHEGHAAVGADGGHHAESWGVRVG